MGRYILCGALFPGRLRSLLLIALLYCSINLLAQIQNNRLTPNIHYVESKQILARNKTSIVKPPSPVYVDPQQNRTRKVILLVSNKRSGSSFVGEMFMRNPKAFYLFEPLFPYSRECNRLQQERIDTLEKFSRCKFNDIEAEHEKIFNWTRKNDSWAKCQRFNVCFLKNNPTLVNAYNDYFHGRTAGLVGITQNLNGFILSKLCHASDFTVFKVLRTCDISSLFHLLNGKLPNTNFKIIHLLRDPRAIISSRLQVPQDMERERENFKENTEKLCTKMQHNLHLTDGMSQSTGKYMRVRLEDIALDPLKYAQLFYQFIDEPFPTEVEVWLDRLNSKQQESAAEQRMKWEKQLETFQTNRKSKDVINEWRRNLDLEMVQVIQRQCSAVLDMLHYKPVETMEQLQDESIQLF